MGGSERGKTICWRDRSHGLRSGRTTQHASEYAFILNWWRARVNPFRHAGGISGFQQGIGLEQLAGRGGFFGFLGTAMAITVRRLLFARERRSGSAALSSSVAEEAEGTDAEKYQRRGLQHDGER